jgi:pyruvate ferredoxin oxidoreductase beta subunit
LFICYDNEAYMNTGVQRSSATPIGASTMTTPLSHTEWGKAQRKKNLSAIALAHDIPYVATASIGFPTDLIRKIKTALSIRGPKYLDIHSPCPIGWGFDSSRLVEVARLAVQTGLVPLFETGYGVPLKSRRISKSMPVVEYLRLQGRFRHLLDREDSEHIAVIQAVADENIKNYHLVAEGAKEAHE